MRSDHSIDENGNIVLVGLSAEETTEFRKLHRTVTLLNDLNGGWTAVHEQRWLDLLDKHEIGQRLLEEANISAATKR